MKIPTKKDNHKIWIKIKNLFILNIERQRKKRASKNKIIYITDIFKRKYSVNYIQILTLDHN
jgi:hypothetical protein